MNKRVMAKLTRIKSKIFYVLTPKLSVLAEFDFKNIISLVVYIAMIPLIQNMLESMSGSLTGTAGTLLASIISIIPLVLVMKVLDKLNF